MMHIPDQAVFFVRAFWSNGYLVLGLVGNIWLVITLSTSVRLKDNFCSKHMKHLAYINTLELVYTCFTFFMETCLRRPLFSGPPLCALLEMVKDSLSISTMFILLNMTFMRTQYTLQPETVKGQRASIVHWDVFFFVSSICLTFLFPPSQSLEMYQTCPISHTPNDHVLSYILLPCTVVLIVLHILIGFRMFMKDKFKDAHGNRYRRYKSLDAIIQIRGMSYLLFRMLPWIYLSDSLRLTQTVGFHEWDLVMITNIHDAVYPHWFFFLWSWRYRREALKKACAYVCNKKPEVKQCSSFENLSEEYYDRDFILCSQRADDLPEYME